ncbi:MAG TPA: hypothetical protein VM759_09925 [Longimicrobium sp.]|nr:hypothetical protein [Longimicrobium sp.]
MTATNVLVRVQAKGGKFLGPDAGYSQVTLTDAATGTVLATGIAEGGSGTLTGGFVAAATRQQIVSAMWGTQVTLWLSATPGQATAGLTAALDLDAPTLVQFTAEALTDGTPNGHTVTQTMWLTPGADLTAEPGVVLVMPGLMVKDVAATVATDPGSLNVSAFVAMMCGCKIDPSLPWQPSEFVVTAVVTDSTGTIVGQAPLTCTGMSSFATAQPITPTGPGPFTVTVTAVQAAEGNIGSATTTYSVPG